MPCTYCSESWSCRNAQEEQTSPKEEMTCTEIKKNKQCICCYLLLSDLKFAQGEENKKTVMQVLRKENKYILLPSKSLSIVTLCQLSTLIVKTAKLEHWTFERKRCIVLCFTSGSYSGVNKLAEHITNRKELRNL